LQSSLSKLSQAGEFIAAIEALCPTNKPVSWQSQQGCLSRVSREAGHLLHHGFSRLAQHPMAASFHAAAFTETCNETFFSVVTMSSGPGRMTAMTHLEWGQALPRAAQRWLRNLPGIENMFAAVKHMRSNTSYARHSHTIPQWVGLPVPLLFARKTTKSAAEKEAARLRSKLVSAARRTVVNLRQLRVRVTTTWKSGSSVGAVYHVAHPVAVASAGLVAAATTDEDDDSSDSGEEDDQLVEAGSSDDYLQLNDDVAVLSAPGVPDGPFWLACIVGISGDQLIVMWYDGSPHTGSYRKFDGQLDVTGVNSVLGKPQLQQVGDNDFELDEEAVSLFTELAQHSRAANRRPAADQGRATNIRQVERNSRPRKAPRLGRSSVNNNGSGKQRVSCCGAGGQCGLRR